MERARQNSENCAVHSVFGVQRECQRAGEKLECSPEAGISVPSWPRFEACVERSLCVLARWQC